MPIDLSRSLRAALEAALEPPEPAAPKKPHLTAGRAIVLGAGLMTAGRLVAKSRGRDLLDSLQRSLAPDGEPDADEEYDEDEAPEDEAPEDEAAEDFEDPEPQDAPDDEVDEEDGTEEDVDEEPAPRRSRSRGRG